VVELRKAPVGPQQIIQRNEHTHRAGSGDERCGGDVSDGGGADGAAGQSRVGAIEGVVDGSRRRIERELKTGYDVAPMLTEGRWLELGIESRRLQLLDEELSP